MMGRIIKFELKKLLGNRLVLVMLVLLSILNVCKIQGDFQKTVGQNTQFYDAYFALYEDASGAWDNAKIAYVIAEYDKAKAVIDTGNFSTEPNQPGTHTGYIFGDCGLFEMMKTEMETLYHYGDTMDALTEKAADNAAFYREKGNDYLAVENEKIEKTYGGRAVSAFYDTWGLTEYFKYDLSTLFILLLLIPLLAPLFAKEHEIEMYGLLKITQNGRKLALCKLLAGALAVCLVSLFFLLQDFAAFTYIYHIDGFSQPIYALADFFYAPLTVSVGGYIALNAALKLLGFLVLGGICMLFSALVKNEILPFCGAFAVTVLFVLGDAFVESQILSVVNPVTLLASGKLFHGFQVVRVLDTPVFAFWLPIFAACLFLMLLSILTLRCSAYAPRQRGRKSK